jgi:hypothetical protein
VRIIVTLELNPLASRRDFDTLREMQSSLPPAGLPVNVYHSVEELLAAVAGAPPGSSFGGGCCAQVMQPEPLADPRLDPRMQSRRLDEIERQLGKVIDLLHRTNAAVDAHAKHLGNLDCALGTLRRDLGGVVSVVEQKKPPASCPKFVPVAVDLPRPHRRPA